ncbi:MAG: broad specificity phosphatase PhoE [Halieaceae bacterium]
MSASGRIYLVRHGEAAASWGESADPGLSELGRRQAMEAATRLQGDLVGLDVTLVSSPLQRAKETAAALVGLLDKPLSIDERFAEIPSPVPLAERQPWLRDFMRQVWSTQDESLVSWRSAMIQGIGELPGSAVVFTHFLVINSILGWLQQREETLVAWPANASVTVLSLVDGELRLETLGEQMRTRVN